MESIGKLRNMATIYLSGGKKILLLYRQGGRVVDQVWTGSAGGHFEEYELNDAKACVLREMEEELGITEDMSAAYMMEHYLKTGIHNDRIYGGIADGSKVIFTELPEF